MSAKNSIGAIIAEIVIALLRFAFGRKDKADENNKIIEQAPDSLVTEYDDTCRRMRELEQAQTRTKR